jgi:uncharacterized protein (TIGR00369 family)
MDPDRCIFFQVAKANQAAIIKKRQEKLIGVFDKAPIKHTFGMELRYDDEGSAIFDMPYNPGLDHYLGGIHGGVMATLLDNAGWFTAAALYDSWLATAEFHVRLLDHAEKVDIYSKGEVIRSGKKMAVCSMEVRTVDFNKAVLAKISNAVNQGG